MKPSYAFHNFCVDTDKFFSCAQVKVVGGGNGTPGPTVKFPGAYKKDDPSFNFSIYNGYKDYPMPGPEVWTGGSGSSPASEVASVNATATATATTSNEEIGDTCGSHFIRRAHPRAFSY